MKHTRVPRTVRRDIWQLAIEISSIPSLHIFSKPNSESDRKSNGKPEKKKRNRPNRKSNCLTKKKSPHTLYHIELFLGLIDVVQGLRLAANLLDE